MKKESVVSPWEVSGEVDYNNLIKDFGVDLLNKDILSKLKEAPPIIRRGLYFTHRDLPQFLADAEKGNKISIVSGRGPSGKMHLGHLIPFIAVKYLQEKYKCPVYIPISDDEKFFFKKDLTQDQVAIHSQDNIIDLIALGFEPKKTFIYTDFSYAPIYKYASAIAKKINLSTAKAVFGFEGESNIGMIFYPAIQSAHIYLPQFLLGSHRTLVPIAIDQDPYMRVLRDVADKFNFIKPSALHSKFLPSLSGSVKMSSSDSSNEVIYLTDSPEEVKRKINKYAFSGGRDTLEEHRKLGGNPDIDISFQYLKYLFEPDDKKLAKIESDYKSGKLLSGELKAILIEKINIFLKEHQKNREKAKKQVDKFMLK
ncbi:MAG: tryptophan--tRNA ligase [Nanoarchaeota archaeon]